MDFIKEDFEILSDLENGYVIKVGVLSLPLFIRKDYYIFNDVKVTDYQKLKVLVGSLSDSLSRENHPQVKFIKSFMDKFPQLIVARVDWFDNLVALDLRLVGSNIEQIFIAYKKDAIGNDRFMCMDTWYASRKQFDERINSEILYYMEQNKSKMS